MLCRHFQGKHPEKKQAFFEALRHVDDVDASKKERH